MRLDEEGDNISEEGLQEVGGKSKNEDQGSPIPPCHAIRLGDFYTKMTW
jgi:hypothetical protein